MTIQVTRLGFLSFAKLQAFIFGILGIVLGVIYSFGGLFLDTLVTLGWITSPETSGLSHGTLLAFGALLGMPLIFIIAGFIFGFVEALVFNFFANRINGITISVN